MSSKFLQLDQNENTDNSIKASTHVFYDVSPFDLFDNKDEMFEHYFTFNEKLGDEL